MNLPHVPLHQQPLSEQLGAVLALVGPLLFVLGQHVFPQRRASVEGSVAHVAAEGLLSRVGPYVLRHVPFQLETLAAEVAAVGPLPRVHPHVVLQVALAGDLLAADVTVKVPPAVLRFAFVRLQVPREHRLFGEYQVAYVAAVQGGPHLLFALTLLRVLLARFLRLPALLLRRSAVLQLLHRLDEFFRQGVSVVAVLRRRLLLAPVDPNFLPLLLVLVFNLGGPFLVLTPNRAPVLILRRSLFLGWRYS